MDVWKQIDWQMFSFVGLTLMGEYLNTIHFPQVYYWNGHRDYRRRIGPRNKDDDDQNHHRAS